MKVLVQVFVLNFQRHLAMLHVELRVSYDMRAPLVPGHYKMLKELNNGHKIPLTGRNNIK